MLQEHNSELSNYKKNVTQADNSFLNGMRGGNSFTETISNKDLERIFKQREEIKHQKQENKYEGNVINILSRSEKDIKGRL